LEVEGSADGVTWRTLVELPVRPLPDFNVGYYPYLQISPRRFLDLPLDGGTDAIQHVRVRLPEPGWIPFTVSEISIFE
jgi:hypothetical protein